ncbi:hypothetical protein CapIbe_002741 [Capra ibex]
MCPRSPTELPVVGPQANVLPSDHKCGQRNGNYSLRRAPHPHDPLLLCLNGLNHLVPRAPSRLLGDEKGSLKVQSVLSWVQLQSQVTVPFEA